MAKYPEHEKLATRKGAKEPELRRGDRILVHKHAEGRRELGALPNVAKVMAVADNWAMVRYPNCVPFTVYVKGGKEWSSAEA